MHLTNHENEFIYHKIKENVTYLKFLVECIRLFV